MKNKDPRILPPTRWELFTIRLLVVLGVVSIVNFVYWFFQPEYQSNTFLYILLAITIIYGLLRKFYMWYHYLNISVPEKPAIDQSFTVDILTTYFPGEPYEMIENTLKAIQNINYPHTAYLCDEANDPYLIELCKKLNVKHITRSNRINAKAGNINNGLKYATGDICVILDPDHIPEPHFLDPIIPHFNNPEIGYVQIVQSYYNLRESLVAKGAAEQTFQFYGPMMMTMNSYGTVNAIGANCTFRRAALDSIGGHAPGLAEDMHTAMLLHAKGWKSVYIPQVLAKGLAPSSLLSFYKQQLKWARGTFDLLFKVYPKLFTKFTFKQKIHYGLLPLHYLIGVMYFFSFMIPILSLLTSRTPWSGNFIYFIMITFPVAVSSLLIRSYIQKWVIEKKERGFHLIGGLLQITTWWIYFLGFFYTLINKKVPYLPTPKDGEEKTNLAITIPNVCIGLLSVFSVFYGLSRDFTPFALIMAGFALLNTFFMFFSVYLATRTTNKNQILRSMLNEYTVSFLVKIKQLFRGFSSLLFKVSNRIALPGLIFTLLVSQLAVERYEYNQWEGVRPIYTKKHKQLYKGIFYPSEEGGKSNIKSVRLLEKTTQEHFDIVSLYHAWGDKNVAVFPEKEISDIYANNAIPLLSWEPWGQHMIAGDSVPELKEEKHIFKHIAAGTLDSYIIQVGKKIKALNRPLFLRFAHEFDNPNYPWSYSGGNSAEDFKNAWIHVHTIFNKIGVYNAIWVWNPWTYKNLEAFYPGDNYVDWIGITALNYGTLNKDGKWYSFEELYHPYSEALKKLSAKPVMLAEFGSLKRGGDQEAWLKKAIVAINTKYPNIKSVVLFNSSIDKNVPKSNTASEVTLLDWSTHSLGFMKHLTVSTPPDYLQHSITSIDGSAKVLYADASLSTVNNWRLKGVTYKKGQNWFHNYYVPSRESLLKDFKLMAEAGINTIKYQGPTVYDHNILNLAKTHGFQIIYSLYIPGNIDFIRDKHKLKKLENRILKTVRNVGANTNIIAWNLGNDTWNELQEYYNKPILTYQRNAYLKWVKLLLEKIKKIDKKPVILELKLSSQTSLVIDQFISRGLKPDCYGLLTRDSMHLSSFQLYARAKKIPFIININSLENVTSLPEGNYIIGNWQDQRESHLVSFDGLLDFKGRRKKVFYEVKNNRKIQFPDSARVKFNILRPSVVITKNRKVTYRAMVLKENQWQYASSQDPKFSLEWWLVKNDHFGNPIAVKQVSRNEKAAINIPDEYQRYKLLLKVISFEGVETIETSLNTPLHSSRQLPSR